MTERQRSANRVERSTRGRFPLSGRERRVAGRGAVSRQRGMFCLGCGSARLCAREMCRACYNAHYRSQTYFSGFREEVLDRDGWRCRVCGEPTNVVHHRRPGKNHPRYLISLCPAHHAVVTRLLLLDHPLPPLLFLLWREQHPDAPEQRLLPLPTGDSQSGAGDGNGARFTFTPDPVWRESPEAAFSPLAARRVAG